MKIIKKLSLLTILSIFVMGTNMSSILAETELNNQREKIKAVDESIMPQKVKDVILYGGQVELEEHLSSEIQPSAVRAGVGVTNNDSRAFGPGNEGWNVLSATIVDDGFWNGFIYYTFEGWGYSSYVGRNYTPNAYETKVSVRATGAIPRINIGGSSTWSLLSSSRVVANDSSSSNLAMANFENVKITWPTTLYTIFENEATLRFPSNLGSYSVTEDIWFWFV